MCSLEKYSLNKDHQGFASLKESQTDDPEGAIPWCHNDGTQGSHRTSVRDRPIKDSTLSAQH